MSGTIACFASLILNLVLAVVLTPVFEAIGPRRGKDVTTPADYGKNLAPEEPIELGKEALGYAAFSAVPGAQLLDKKLRAISPR